MATTDKLMTADELWRLPDDGQRHELVAGELRTMAPSGGEHGWIVVRVTTPLDEHVRANKLGLVFGAETGFALARDPDTVRAADVAFVRRERVLAAGDVKGYWPGAPDLAVEVISPNDLYTEVDEKVADWLASGTLMVLVVNPRRRAVAVHRPHQAVRVLAESDVVDGEDVVPGWTLRVGDIFSHGLAD
jgi:Uma2 family endonuclease